MRLNLPEEWLQADWGQILWDTLSQETTLAAIRRSAGPLLELELVRGEIPGCETRLEGLTPRVYPWAALRQWHRQRLFFLLHLPEPWHRLLEGGKLVFGVDPGLLEQCRQGVVIWFRSKPGRELLHLCGIDPGLIEDQQQARRLIISRDLPLPAEELLLRLEHLPAASAEPSDAWPTDDLPGCLGEDFTRLPPLQGTSSPSRIQQTPRSRPPRSLEHELAEKVFVDGIPRFPEHYLYDHFRPELQTFRWTGPFELENAFFDYFRLCDAAGVCYEIAGEAIARGLWLASRTGLREAGFPIDPQLAEVILRRYLDDLKERHQVLAHLAHQRTTDPKTAERLVRRIWNHPDLPPWEAVEETDAIFSGNS